jgi:hypothetical protein
MTKGRVFQVPEVFEAEVKPTLTHEKTIIYAVKSLLGEIARVETAATALRLVELAMREAVLGDNPRIELTLTEGLLGYVSDASIALAVEKQLLTDDLIQSLLDNNIVEIKLKL